LSYRKSSVEVDAQRLLALGVHNYSLSTLGASM